MSNSEKLYIAGVKREPGYLYYLDKDCNVARSVMVRGGTSNKARRPSPEVVVETNIEREESYLYFIDKQGDVARTKMSRGGSGRCRRKAKPKPRFRMRKKPETPKKGTVTKTKENEDFPSLADLIIWASEENLKADEVWFDGDFIAWEEPETSDEFKARKVKHKKALAKWNVWAEDNADKIAEREEKERAKKKRRA